MGLTSAQKSFVDKIWPSAVKAGNQTGVSPLLITAQAALESGWGKHAPNNNFFGIKGPGGSQSTREFINGKWITITDSFRGYTSLEASVAGWADFVTKNPRYKPLLAAGDWKDELAALGKSGYATDPKYTDKLAAIINSLPQGARVNDALASGRAALEGAGVSLGAALDAGKALVDNVAGGVTDAVDDATKGVGGFLDFFKQLFSASTMVRVIVVLVGVLVLAAALFAFLRPQK